MKLLRIGPVKKVSVSWSGWGVWEGIYCSSFTKATMVWCKGNIRTRVNFDNIHCDVRHSSVFDYDIGIFDCPGKMVMCQTCWITIKNEMVSFPFKFQNIPNSLISIWFHQVQSKVMLLVTNGITLKFGSSCVPKAWHKLEILEIR